MTFPNEQTLTEALLILGITHRPSKIVGKRDLFAPNGEPLGAHDANEAWAFLKRGVDRVAAERAA